VNYAIKPTLEFHTYQIVISRNQNSPQRTQTTKQKMKTNSLEIDQEAGVDINSPLTLPEKHEYDINYKQRFNIPDWCKLIETFGNSLTQSLHGLSKDCGWWTDLDNGQRFTNTHPRVDELIVHKLLKIHTEISEACEGHCCSKMDDKLPHRTMLECELADAAIRIFDLAGFLGFDLGTTIVEKSKFNASRPDHTLEERRKKGGKKY
jgi:hypothetical protein